MSLGFPNFSSMDFFWKLLSLSNATPTPQSFMSKDQNAPAAFFREKERQRQIPLRWYWLNIRWEAI